jgi:2-keto-4-pentenoate hydratase
MPFSGQDLQQHVVTMRVNGVEKGAGTGSRALGDPLNVMLWLVNHQSTRRVSLKAGEIVSTRTCTGLDPVQPGDLACADFRTLGAVEIVFKL